MSFSTVEIRRRPAMALFAITAMAMVVGSYMFVLLLAAACVLFPYFFLTNAESFNLQVLFLFLFGIVIAGALLWSLIPRRDKFERPGMLLDRKAHPRLFTELESIANALNEPLPREVYLIGAPNAFVADRGGVMGFGSRRTMGLGLPLLSLLTVSQFRAVLAHEFAHYYGGDTSLGPWVYKTKSSMVRIFENIGSVRQLARVAVLGIMYIVVATLLKWYFIAFLRVIHLISRKQEYRADELACLIAGRQNLIDGLQSIHRAAVAWPSYWQNEVAPSLGEGSLPAVGDGFLRYLTAPQISAAISEGLATRLQEEKTKPYDTHPPLRDRIAAAQKLPDCARPQDTQPASTLLDHLAATELSFVEQCVTKMQPGTLKYIGWDDVGTEVTIPAWERFVAKYAEHLRGVTAESVPDYVAKLPQIGSRIRDPKGMLLSPSQRTARAGILFASALSLAMLRCGWKLEVQPASFHMGRDNQDFNPFEAIHQLMAGKICRQDWLNFCNEFGISGLSLFDQARNTALPQPVPAV
jgi:Zn-dependent protease with chaperone function